MTTSVLENIKKFNKVVKAIKEIDTRFENVTNYKEYDDTCNERVDALYVARDLAEEIQKCIQSIIDVECIGGHIGTTMTRSEVEAKLLNK